MSVLNAGSAPTLVTAIIRVQPLGHSKGHFDSGRSRAAVAGFGAVALQLPTMAVVPGEHALVTIELIRPPRSDVARRAPMGEGGRRRPQRRGVTARSLPRDAS